MTAHRGLRERIRRWTCWPMLWKEFVQMRRDRITFGMMTVLPAVQLLLFGYAIQTDVRNLPMVVYDQSRSSESRSLAQTLENTDVFRIVGAVSDETQLRGMIERGDARAPLVIPPDYAPQIARGLPATAQLIVDANGTASFPMNDRLKGAYNVRLKWKAGDQGYLVVERIYLP